jgi:type IV secretory pathway VirB2 component (pilin)
VKLLHNVVAATLGLTTVLLLVFSAVVGWMHQTVLVTDRFVSVVTDVTEDPLVVAAVSDRLAAQVVTALDVQLRLENLLPDRLDQLAGRVTTAVQTRIGDAAEQLLLGEGFKEGWNKILTALHSGLLSVLRGEADNVQLSDGSLTIDLLGIGGVLIADLQADGVLPTDISLPDFGVIDDRDAFLASLGTALDAQLPADFGQVEIADAAALSRLSALVQQSDMLVVALPLIGLIFLGLTLLWANQRWRALFRVALGVIVLVGIMWLALAGAQGWAADALTRPDSRVVLSAFVGELAESLSAWLGGVAAMVAVVAVIAFFFSRRASHRAARAASDQSAGSA